MAENKKRTVGILAYYYPPTNDSGRGMDRFSFELFKGIRASKRYTPIVLTHKGKSVTSFGYHCLKLQLTKNSVYHAVDIVNGMSGIILGKKPLITHIHDIHPFVTLKNHPELKYYFSGIKGSLRRKAGDLCIKKSDVLITPFPSNKSFILDKYGLDDEKIQVIPYGVDTTVFFRQPCNPEKIDDRNIVLCVSSLLKERGVEELIFAFNDVCKFVDAILLIIGKGKDQNHFRKIVNQMNLADKVRFLGFVPDEKLRYYYNIADVFVFTSKLGFSLACLEAMACGTPVITTDSYDAKDILKDAAIIVQPGNIDELSKCMIKVLTNEQIKNELINKSLNLSRSYSWTKMNEQFIHLYDRLLGL